MVMVAWVAEFVIALSSGRDASVLHHKTAKDKGKNRTLVDQNVLLRITFKYRKYAFENHNQERKYADENQFRLYIRYWMKLHRARSLADESAHRQLRCPLLALTAAASF